MSEKTGLRNPTRAAKAELPETLQAGFLSRASVILSERSPQVAALIGAQARALAQFVNAPRGTLECRLCDRCGLPLLPAASCTVKVLPHTPSRGPRGNKVLWRCSECGHADVRPGSTSTYVSSKCTQNEARQQLATFANVLPLKKRTSAGRGKPQEEAAPGPSEGAAAHTEAAPVGEGVSSSVGKVAFFFDRSAGPTEPIEEEEQVPEKEAEELGEADAGRPPAPPHLLQPSTLSVDEPTSAEAPAAVTPDHSTAPPGDDTTTGKQSCEPDNRQAGPTHEGEGDAERRTATASACSARTRIAAAADAEGVAAAGGAGRSEASSAGAAAGGAGRSEASSAGADDRSPAPAGRSEASSAGADDRSPAPAGTPAAPESAPEARGSDRPHVEAALASPRTPDQHADIAQDAVAQARVQAPVAEPIQAPPRNASQSDEQALPGSPRSTLHGTTGGRGKAPSRSNSNLRRSESFHLASGSFQRGGEAGPREAPQSLPVHHRASFDLAKGKTLKQLSRENLLDSRCTVLDEEGETSSDEEENANAGSTFLDFLARKEMELDEDEVIEDEGEEEPGAAGAADSAQPEQEEPVPDRPPASLAAAAPSEQPPSSVEEAVPGRPPAPLAAAAPTARPPSEPCLAPPQSRPLESSSPLAQEVAGPAGLPAAPAAPPQVARGAQQTRLGAAPQRGLSGLRSSAGLPARSPSLLAQRPPPRPAESDDSEDSEGEGEGVEGGGTAGSRFLRFLERKQEGGARPQQRPAQAALGGPPADGPAELPCAMPSQKHARTLVRDVPQSDAPGRGKGEHAAAADQLQGDLKTSTQVLAVDPNAAAVTARAAARGRDSNGVAALRPAAFSGLGATVGAGDERGGGSNTLADLFQTVMWECADEAEAAVEGAAVPAGAPGQAKEEHGVHAAEKCERRPGSKERGSVQGAQLEPSNGGQAGAANHAAVVDVEASEGPGGDLQPGRRAPADVSAQRPDLVEGADGRPGSSDAKEGVRKSNGLRKRRVGAGEVGGEERPRKRAKEGTRRAMQQVGGGQAEMPGRGLKQGRAGAFHTHLRVVRGSTSDPRGQRRVEMMRYGGPWLRGLRGRGER